MALTRSWVPFHPRWINITDSEIVRIRRSLSLSLIFILLKLERAQWV